MGTFTEQREISTYWYNKASDLRAAAAAVYYAIENDSDFPKAEFGLSSGFSMGAACPTVYRMLCGMALEALLKAIIVENGNEPRQTHNLNQLARDADVTFPQQDQKLLQILSEATIWDGRYPVPKNERHWDALNDLEKECLFDKKPLGEGNLCVYLRNERLRWKSFEDLWAIPMTELCRVATWIEH